MSAKRITAHVPDVWTQAALEFKTYRGRAKHAY